MCNWVQYILLLSANLINNFSNNQTKCNEPIQFYENKFCEEMPSTDLGNAGLERFDCDGINFGEREEGCFYVGRYYKPGEQVDYLQEPAFDTILCRCKQNTRDFNSSITGRNDPVLPDLILENNSEVGYNSTSNTSNFFRCNVQGTYYNEGQIFESPNDKCKQCICNTNFRGVYDSQVCKPKPCPVELWHNSEVLNFCAPVYINRGDCCPFDFYCPTTSDEKHMKLFTPTPGNLFCQWGKNIQLKLGTKMSRSSSINGATTKTKCECVKPPYLTCYKISE